MSCNIGLNKAITKILNDKPWFKYKQGDTFIEILESPATRINKKSSIGVANNLAIAINKLVNKGNKKIGDVVYPAFNSNGWGIVEIRPKSIQLDLINATEIDEINRLQEEIFEEERLKQLEEERIREEELTEEQLENREYFQQDEPYTSDFISEDEDNIPLTPIVSTKPIQEEKKDDKGQFKLFNVDFTLKAVDILQSDKAKQVFEKGQNANWDLNKILSELQIPKEQKQLLLDLGITDREELALELASKYSYAIEINIAKELPKNTIKKIIYYEEENQHEEIEIDIDDQITKTKEGKYRASSFDKNNEKRFSLGDFNTLDELYEDLGKDFAKPKNATPTQHYASLTVPGGTNYTEQEISTPLITPSIKGHAQFATDKGIGWFRSDDKSSQQKKEFSDLLNKNRIEDTDKINELRKTKDLPTKTRRILEVQSDLFQKWKNSFNTSDGTHYTKKNEGENNKPVYRENRAVITKERYDNAFEEFLNWNNGRDDVFQKLLLRDNNWVTFFVKSIIQSTAKETVTEVQQEDVEAKVRELERNGLLKIKCD